MTQQNIPFNMIYDPTVRDMDSPGSYNFCRNRIDEAFKAEIIDQESKEELIGSLNRIQGEYLASQGQINTHLDGNGNLEDDLE